LALKDLIWTQKDRKLSAQKDQLT